MQPNHLGLVCIKMPIPRDHQTVNLNPWQCCSLRSPWLWTSCMWFSRTTQVWEPLRRAFSGASLGLPWALQRSRDDPATSSFSYRHTRVYTCAHTQVVFWGFLFCFFWIICTVTHGRCTNPWIIKINNTGNRNPLSCCRSERVKMLAVGILLPSILTPPHL